MAGRYPLRQGEEREYLYRATWMRRTRSHGRPSWRRGHLVITDLFGHQQEAALTLKAEAKAPVGAILVEQLVAGRPVENWLFDHRGEVLP